MGCCRSLERILTMKKILKKKIFLPVILSLALVLGVVPTISTPPIAVARPVQQSTYTKTQGTSVLSLQSVASGAVLISSAIDVSTKIAATLFIHFGRRATSALTVGAQFRIEASSKSSGDGHWFPIFIYTTDVVASESEAVSGTVSAGTNVITVASTTNLVVGDIIYIDNGTIANSEWGRIKSVVTNTSVTIEDNLVNAQTGATIFDQAQIFRIVDVNCRAIGRLRLVVDNTGTGQAIAVEAAIVTADSFGS